MRSVNRWRLGSVILLALVIAVVGFRGVGRWLDREDTLSHGDVIFVFSGAMPHRAEEGGRAMPWAMPPKYG